MSVRASIRAALGSLLQRRRDEDPPGVTVPASLVRSAKLASWLAYLSLVYFLWLYTLDIARDRSADLELTRAGTWSGHLSFAFPYIVGFAVVAIGIPYVAKLAIPTFMSLTWREHAWPKAWSLFIALSVSLVVIAGTFTVQGDTMLERDRSAAVAVSGVEQANTVRQARIAALDAELRTMMENRNSYLAQAASVGAAEWQRSYIDQTPRADPQRDRIVRALGAARRADAIRAELNELRTEAASAQPTAAVQGRVVTTETRWLAGLLAWIEGARAMLLSMVMDIVCLLMPWIAMRLEQARAQQLAAVSPREFDSAYAIEDLRNEPPITPQPMEGVREVVTDGETGEQLERIQPRSYWRRKKGQRQRVRIEGDRLPDEPGAAVDGGGRAPAAVRTNAPRQEPEADELGASVGAPPAPEIAEPAREPAQESEISDEDAEAILALEETPPQETPLPNAEGVMINEEENV